VYDGGRTETSVEGVTPRDKRFGARDGAARKEAARAAGARRDASALPALLHLLRDHSTSVAAAALWALSRIADPATVEPIAALLKAPAAALRSGAVHALVALATPEAVAPLIAALPEGDEALVAAILEGLGTLPDPLVVPALITLLHDERGQARARASRALLQRPAASSPAVVAALDATSAPADSGFRRAAAHVLAESAAPASLDALLALSRDDDTRTRLYAARGLGKLSAEQDARERLHVLRSDERRDIAAVATSALDGPSTEASTDDADPVASVSSTPTLALSAGLNYLLMTAPGLEDVVAGSIEAFGKSRVLRRYQGVLQVVLDAPSASLDVVRTVYDALLFAGILPQNEAQTPRFRDTKLLRAAFNAVAAAYPDLPRTLYVGVPRDMTAGEAKRLRTAAAGDLALVGAQLAAPGAPAALTAEIVMLDGRPLLGIRLRERASAQSIGGTVQALAAAMVLLTEPEPDDVFLDPLCGTTGGALLRERELVAPYDGLVGVENAPRVLAKVREVLAATPDLTLHRKPPTALDLGAGTVDAAAALLRGPGLPEDSERFYSEIVESLAQVVKPGGRVVLGVVEARLMTAVLRAERGFARTSSTVLTVETVGGPIALFVLRRR